jgi:DNA-binding NarL/FixJ family response regulator
MTRARILIADDHTLIAEAFKKLLEPEFEVVGMVPDGRALVHVAAQLKPDVILVDIGMPKLNGLDAGRQLKKLLPSTKIIVVTMSEDTDIAAEALRECASGYLLKSSAGSELVKAIASVLRGKTYVTPRIEAKQLEAFVRNPHPHQAPTLTGRQREVLQLLAEGRSMKEAAAELRVAARTVAFHKYRIMEEHDLRTNSDLMRFAIRQHLLTAS